MLEGTRVKGSLYHKWTRPRIAVSVCTHTKVDLSRSGYAQVAAIVVYYGILK